MWLIGLGLTALAGLPVHLTDAVASRDCAAVAQALPSPSTPEERLAAGWCAVEVGDPTRAAQILAPVTQGVLGDYARWQRARALSATGQHDRAIKALDGLRLPGPAGLGVRLARARASLGLHRSLDARPDLRVLLNTSVASEARYLLAQGGLDRDETKAARATFQRVWATSTRGPWADRSAQALEALGSAVPDASNDAGRALIAERIRALQKDKQHTEALPLAKLIGAQQAPTPSGHADAARASFKARDYPSAVEHFAKALGEPEMAVGSAALLFDYALATSRTGDYDAAAVIYRRVVAQHPASKKGDFASYKLGYLEYDRHALGAAIPLFRAHLKRYPASAHRNEALWFLGRSAWRLEQLDEALAAWTSLTTSKGAGSLAAGAHYWLARLQGRRGDAEGERTGLEAVIRRYPVSGYAFFAATTLGKTFPKVPPATVPALPPALSQRSSVQRARALLDVGMRGWALAELGGLAGQAAGAGRSGELGAAWLLLQAGSYKQARRLASPHCTKAYKTGAPEAQQVCRPMPEGTLVRRVADHYGLHPYLPFAIMTAESNLDPAVTSVAGARGLMQIMPAELARIHADLRGQQDVDIDWLYEAPYNASMGTTELGMKARSLGDTLQGSSLPAIIASYNGGEAAVRRWLARYDGKPRFDEFAEDIGYTETRRYVRRVLGYLMAYRWVYGDP